MKRIANRKEIVKVLSLIAIFGISYFGLVILLLSLFDTDYNPIALAASDYGVGRFASEMNFGFFIAGIGMIAFALGYKLDRLARKSKVGFAFLFVAGLILIMDSYFTTNIPGAPATLHGTIHGFGGLFFFITAPVGLLLITRKTSRGRFKVTLVALIIGFVILAAPLNASGFAERVILLVIFASVIVSSVSLYSQVDRSNLEKTTISSHSEANR